MTVTREWKVYGMDGHRQRESFNPSARYDFSEGDNIRILEVLNSDRTGTNDYSIIRITRNTAEECEREFDGQLSDGVFENARTGRIEEVTLFYTASAETGDIIEEVKTLAEGLELIAEYEEEDKANGVYEDGFYNVVGADRCKVEYNFDYIKKLSRMGDTELSRLFEIPLRTVQNWSGGVRECAEYLVKLMEYRLTH